MLALIDGDIVAYTVASGCDDYSEKTVLSKCAEYVEDLVFNYAECDDAVGFLTGKNNFRDSIAKTKPYKGNRTQPKPKYLSFVREYLCDAWGFVVSENQEADDAIGIEAYTLDPDSYVICTTDKDLNMIRGWHYNPMKNMRFFVPEADTLKHFYTQILTGDRVDNIPGLYGIGPKKAEKILKDAKSETDMFKAVLEAYDNNIEYLMEQGQLLWIRRQQDEIWQPPC